MRLRPEPEPINTASFQLPLFASPTPAIFGSPTGDAFEQDIDLNALLISNQPATYLMKMAGKAMMPTIWDQDIVIVDRSLTPQAQDIVVMAVEGEFLVRRFERQQDRILLTTETPTTPALVITPEMEATLFGVVRWILHRTRRRAR
jgi:DNA polymerase V